MCYSAMVVANWKQFVSRTGIRISLREFAKLAEERARDAVEFKLPRGFDREFANPQNDDESAVKAEIDRYREVQTSKLEQEIFAQRKRLADAERKLAEKETKAAAEDKRIAGNKVLQALDRLTLLKNDAPHPNDYRIFPGNYAPIIVMRDGEKVMIPARYLCRLPGAPAFMDRQLSGNYNARRDNLTKFWRGQFGNTHAVMVVESFFENVTGKDGQNEVLRFVPRPAGLMWIACLYAEWLDPKTGETLVSFAAITDEPPPEVAAVGHDRMIVSLAPEAVDLWLTPKGRSLEELQAILDMRDRPYYEHQIAA
jgi:putative SOS response-associated peptidase YedK